MSPIGRWQWAAAIFVATLLHVAATGALTWVSPPPGAVAAGRGGLAVSLAAAGGFPAGAETAAAETAAAASPAAMAPTRPPDTVPTEHRPDAAQPAPLQMARAVTSEVSDPPRTETVAPAAVVPAPPLSSKAVSAVDSPPVDPIPAMVETTSAPTPTPTSVRAVEAAAVAATPIAAAAPGPAIAAQIPPIAQTMPPRPRQKPVPPVETAAVPPPAEAPFQAADTVVDTALAELAQNTGPAETVENADAGLAEAQSLAALSPAAGGSAGAVSGDSGGSDAGAAAGGGRPGAMADFAALLQAWLEQHKRYPQRARHRNERGVVMLRFVLLQDGRVREYEIVESSGSVTLDDAARKLLERAQPMPKIPTPLGHAQLEFVVPIAYELH